MGSRHFTESLECCKVGQHRPARKRLIYVVYIYVGIREIVRGSRFVMDIIQLILIIFVYRLNSVRFYLDVYLSLLKLVVVRCGKEKQPS